MKGISETDFSKQVEDLMNLYGWRWTHFRPAMNESGRWRTPLSGHKGFPDYVAVHAGKKRLLFVELKSDKGRESAEQSEWLNDLEVAGKGEVYLWRPADIDTIVEILK